MAFDFLDTLSGVIDIGAGLYDAFRKHDSRSADAMYAMLGASVDPNSPQFKNLAALFAERSKSDAIKNIQMMMNQNAREKARGGSGFIVNPERRDESRTAALNEAFMKARADAQMQAHAALSGTASQYAAGVPYDVSQDKLKSQQVGAIGNAASDLVNLFADRKVYPETYGDRAIYWDRPRTEF